MKRPSVPLTAFGTLMIDWIDRQGRLSQVSEFEARELGIPKGDVGNLPLERIYSSTSAQALRSIAQGGAGGRRSDSGLGEFAELQRGPDARDRDPRGRSRHRGGQAGIVASRPRHRSRTGRAGRDPVANDRGGDGSLLVHRIPRTRGHVAGRGRNRRPHLHQPEPVARLQRGDGPPLSRAGGPRLQHAAGFAIFSRYRGQPPDGAGSRPGELPARPRGRGGPQA